VDSAKSFKPLSEKKKKRDKTRKERNKFFLLTHVGSIFVVDSDHPSTVNEGKNMSAANKDNQKLNDRQQIGQQEHSAVTKRSHNRQGLCGRRQEIESKTKQDKKDKIHSPLSSILGHSFRSFVSSCGSAWEFAKLFQVQ
jgi:hypothetical protein